MRNYTPTQSINNSRRNGKSIRTIHLMDNRERLIDFIQKATGQSNIIAFPRILVDITGGIKSAVFMSQLVYWSDKGKRTDGYIYKKDSELANETGLSLAEIKRIKPKLIELGFIQIKRKKANGAPTTHYLVNIANIEKAINQYSENHPMDQSESNQSDWVKSDQSITEITQKNTTQNTAASEPVPYTSVTCSIEDSIREADDRNYTDYYNSDDEDDDHKEDISWLEDEVLKVCGVSSLSIEEKERVRQIGKNIYHDEEVSYRKFSTPSQSPDSYEIRYIKDKLAWADGIWLKEGRRLSPTQILKAIKKPENKDKWRSYVSKKELNKNKFTSDHRLRLFDGNTINVKQGMDSNMYRD